MSKSAAGYGYLTSPSGSWHFPGGLRSEMVSFFRDFAGDSWKPASGTIVLDICLAVRYKLVKRVNYKTNYKKGYGCGCISTVNPHPEDLQVQTLHATQLAGEMDDQIVELIRKSRRDDAIALLTKQIDLLKQVEHLDDDKCMIVMLIRMAENLQKRLKDQTMSAKATAQKCGHHGSQL
ncbi:unnamed protein product [Adineta steineri]|uniref:Uncharacterized protein n=1 Tax=Adineta steineri TaxID=433720 RepID=A0A819MSX6_9BILA|nr:unnamed protein product [Adineta steineri]CAF1278371.1 unnamed protein product [Adineta steineri]CAF1279385.1 unnamed protein product [Adineta steineri]CAF3965259.1 unnamed protein product [Adineta steineri]CAF3984800.1 unnamed protein product [Adineta steineri]